MSEEFEKYRAEQAAGWLEHVMATGARVRALRAEIDEQRSIASGLRSMVCDGMPRQTCAYGDALPDAVIRIQELVRGYCAELAGYVDEQREAHEALARMDDPLLADVLVRRYLLCRPWSRVCEETGYTYDGIMAVRRRALSAAYDVMPVRFRDPLHRAV